MNTQLTDIEWRERQRRLYEGCLLGGAVGDALGYPVEFISEAAIAHRYGKKGIQTLDEAGKPAIISDDTQMTLFAANAIIYSWTNHIGINVCLKTAYLEWLETQKSYKSETNDKPKMWIYEDRRLHHPRAPGNTCISALSHMKADPETTFAANNSKGCGTVMRAAPFGLMVRRDPKTDYGDSFYVPLRCARYDAALTHGHPLAQASSVMLADIIFQITQYRHDPKAERLEDVIRKAGSDSNELKQLIDRALKLANRNRVADLDAIHQLGEGWIAEEALAIAVFCAVRHQNDFAEALRASVNHKGDSDSTGAVCGNILGAWLGVEAVENAFDLNNLELADVIRTIADDLFTSTNRSEIPEKGADLLWDKRYYNR